ncbi:phosphotransferase family protein [Paenibacillus sp. R14(2021)]|uniref:phosphotransferase family protein n=1 Tax=Paenibacillus sp. R14(2021) TaxID=2859228 RepID=UPI001C61204D|nr:phosphotransferase [Paenibacillus sp. R14(2021)]
MNAWLKQDGSLDETRIVRRETLYTGMNGKRVERFLLVSGDSVVYKPLTNDSQLGKEAWVYANVLPHFPSIYPRLLAHSDGSGAESEVEEPDSASGELQTGASAVSHSGESLEAIEPWCLFEDLGPLSHAFDERIVSELILHMAAWHALPVEALLDAPLLGPKPMIDVLLRDVYARKEELRRALSDLPAGVELVERVLADGDIMPPGWMKRVQSHGDLHLGNYTFVNGEIKVLDWEHVHLNSPYWDLYHVLDLSHPVFPKPADAKVRERMLDLYVQESAVRGIVYDPAAFKGEYARFSAVFSLWMLLLIEKDLASLAVSHIPAKWSPEQLQRQRKETRDSLVQCAAMLPPLQ